MAFSVQYHPEAAAGPHDAAYLFDRFCDRWMGEWWSSNQRTGVRGRDVRPHERMPDAEAHRHLQRPGDRQRADRDRAGLRVRLLRHPGVPGAAPGGAPGRPGELQPGDDHDRPGVRGRDVRRADHAGVRRAGDRQGAPRRAAGHARRPDRAQLRDEPGRGRGPREVRRRADRREHRGDREGREPRVLQADRRGSAGRMGRRGRGLRDLPLDGRLPRRGRGRSATRSWSGPASPWAAPAPAWPTTRRTCAGSPASASRSAPPPRCSWRSRSSAGRSTSWR